MRTLTLTRTIRVLAPWATALAVVQDIGNLEYCEPKVDALELSRESTEGGVFRASGRLAGLRWSGDFRYRLSADGFDSTEASPGRSGLNVRGGFHVAPAGESASRITHYEQYMLPPWALPLKRALAWYVGGSMERELENLARLIAEQLDAARAA